MKISIGADPEGFIQDDSGKFLSAHSFFPGTKESPYKVPHGAIQVDGLAVEFNIDPANSKDEFIHNIHEVQKEMGHILKSTSSRLHILYNPVAHFEKSYFDNLPPETKILGCDPDYTIDGNQSRTPQIQGVNFRTAAGHIHLGWRESENTDETHFQDCIEVAKFFNNNLFSRTVKSYLERERLHYYGSRGAFRPKKYGIELRSPSNVWVGSKEKQAKMFDDISETWNNFCEKMGV